MPRHPTILTEPRILCQAQRAVALKDPILPKDDVSSSGEQDFWTRREHATAAGRGVWGSGIDIEALRWEVARLVGPFTPRAYSGVLNPRKDRLPPSASSINT